MRDWEDEEIESVEERVTDLMFSFCQDCRFLAAMRVIDSVDIDLVKDIREYTKWRLSSSDTSPTYHPVNEPRHMRGGCHACCQH